MQEKWKRWNNKMKMKICSSGSWILNSTWTWTQSLSSSSPCCRSRHSRLLFGLLRVGVREAKEVIGDSTRFTEATQEGAMDSRWVITDRVLTWKEKKLNDILFVSCSIKCPLLRLPLTSEEQTRHLLLLLSSCRGGRRLCWILFLGAASASSSMWRHWCG